jgi:ABC-type cobalt transport system substrate-binding protein
MTKKKTKAAPTKKAVLSKKKASAKAMPKTKNTASKRKKKTALGETSNNPNTSIKPYQPKYQPNFYPMPKKANNSNALLFGVLAVGAASVMGYFGWQYLQKKKTKKTSPFVAIIF